MANQLYGYNKPSNYGGGGAGAAAKLSGGVYTSRSVAADPYLSASDPSSLSLLGSSARYLGTDPLSSSSMLFSHTDGLGSGYSLAAASRISGVTTTPYLASWHGPPGVDVTITSSVDPLLVGLKRPSSEALYPQTVLGAHNMIGQSEAWFSTNPLAKRPRFENASDLPIYPQRPGERDCVHYMQTRTCKFGDSCKFDHPFWVPEGGIPDWKEVPLIATSESLPERPGEPDCPYFLKTQRCKFGLRCKFNHPIDKMVSLGAPECPNASALPERPSEPPCAFYLKTGNCKFGATCKFDHPTGIQIPSVGQENGIGGQIETINDEMARDLQLVNPLFTPAVLHNSKGLPVRLGEVDCPFYLKTGSCKYGTTCRYNHPDRNAINPPAAAVGPAIVASPMVHMNIGVVNPAASILQTIDPRLSQTTLGLGPTIYPQRPGQMECDFYMKTGVCKFGERCKFHHPIDRSAPMLSAIEAQQQNVKLTLAGLPRREGAIHCPYYMKTGACKYGAMCKFDHPPPGEVMAMATSQGASISVGGEDEENEAETIQSQQQ